MKTKYKNVHAHKRETRGANCQVIWFVAEVTRDEKRLCKKTYKTEEEAAKKVDFELIKAGYEPVNGFYKKCS